MEEKRSTNKGPLLIASFLVIALIVCVALLVVRIAKRIENATGEKELVLEIPEQEKEDVGTETEITENTEEENLLEHLETPVTVEEVSFEVRRYIDGDVCVVREEDTYGLADRNGNWIVRGEYTGYVYFDEVWVTFMDEDDKNYVYDHSGNLLYTYDYWGGTHETENGIAYETEVFYRRGMRIEYDASEDGTYQQARFYNLKSGKLIFDTAKLEDIQIISMPDETKMAVVIAGDGSENVIYRITADGYAQETYIEPNVERRFYRFTLNDVWNRTNQSDGWLRTYMEEERGELLDYSNEYAEILYNVISGERVRIPEKYQNYYAEYYQYSKGLYYGIAAESLAAYSDETSEEIYYAICHGSKMLSEEIYAWINFGETYIIAGNDEFSHILNYEGEVLAEYKDVAYPFVDGRTLVMDDIGVFYIDENLEPCTGYIMEDADYVYPDYIRKEKKNYLVHYTGTGQEE